MRLCISAGRQVGLPLCRTKHRFSAFTVEILQPYRETSLSSESVLPLPGVEPCPRKLSLSISAHTTTIMAHKGNFRAYISIWVNARHDTSDD